MIIGDPSPACFQIDEEDEEDADHSTRRIDRPTGALRESGELSSVIPPHPTGTTFK
jgi:hypothetical protein